MSGRTGFWGALTVDMGENIGLKLKRVFRRRDGTFYVMYERARHDVTRNQDGTFSRSDKPVASTQNAY